MTKDIDVFHDKWKGLSDEGMRQVAEMSAWQLDRCACPDKWIQNATYTADEAGLTLAQVQAVSCSVLVACGYCENCRNE